MGKIKYTQEFKDETARFILESRKSACSVATELNIDKNQVCKWVKQYRERNNLPSYEEEKKVRSAKSQKELDLERENKRLKKELAEEREKVEILKKSLHIFMQPQE